METSTLSKPPKDKTCSLLIATSVYLTFSLLLTCFLVEANESPHLTRNLTWQVISQTGDIIWSITGMHTPNTWWPSLHPDLCKLVSKLDSWDLLTGEIKGKTPPGTDIGCRHPLVKHNLQTDPFYVCPRDGQDRGLANKCGGSEDFYCKTWSCETTGDAYWKPSSSWDLITVKRNASNNSNLTICFTQAQKDTDWGTGHTGGLDSI